jgi:hypothetical protein
MLLAGMSVSVSTDCRGDLSWHTTCTVIDCGTPRALPCNFKDHPSLGFTNVYVQCAIQAGQPLLFLAIAEAAALEVLALALTLRSDSTL